MTTKLPCKNCGHTGHYRYDSECLSDPACTCTRFEVDDGADLRIDVDKYNALVAEDEAAWKAFRESDLGKWFQDEFRRAMTEEES